MNALNDALALLWSGDPETYWTIGATLRFSVASTFFAALLGVPFGALLFLSRFRGRRLVVAGVNACMAIPTVVIGLFVYSLISRGGPLGPLDLLYNPGGVILGQTLLALPLVTAMAYTGLQKLDPRYHETLLTLGASRPRRLLAILREGRLVVLQALLLGFGRVTGEVGVAMMLGGNIRWHTRTMTTAIALAINFLSHLAVRDV